MLYRTLVTDLLKHGKVVTTISKAKEVRGMAERMISLGKDNTLQRRRQALAFLTEESAVRKLFSDLAPKYAERPGGYLRITKLGPRLGDGAQMAQIQLVD